MAVTDLFSRLALALAIGLLIGIERGWQEREGKSGSRVAGIRTYALIGLLGGVWGALVPFAGAVGLAAAALGFTGAITLFEWRETQAAGSFSVTALVAGLLVFALGAYAALGNQSAAAFGAVVAAVVLAERRILHEFLEKLSWVELRAALLLLVMTFVLLPILPDRTVDQWHAINPHQIWLMTIFVAAVSYAGYVAVRIVGSRKGLLYAGSVGGLVSSTTITWTFAQLAKQHPHARFEFLVGVLSSWAVAAVRVTVIAAVLSPLLGELLCKTLGPAFIALVAAIAICYHRAVGDGESAQLPLEDPFDLKIVLRFVVLLIAIMLAVKWSGMFFGEPGILSLAAVSGAADVDPITLSMAQSAGYSVSYDQAASAILIALVANTVAKCAMGAVFGGIRFAIPIICAAIVAVGAGAAAFFL